MASVDSMNSRKLMVYIHLSLAALFLPFLLMMPATGTLYLAGIQGSQKKTEAFRITEAPPAEDAAQDAFFREQFARQNIDYDFEYVRASGKDFTFRPTTRVHYVASRDDNGTLTFSKVEPTLLKRLIELHKGHGPMLMRWFEGAFGVSLVLVAFSGLWLAWTATPYRKVTLLSFGAGAAILALCLL